MQSMVLFCSSRQGGHGGVTKLPEGDTFWVLESSIQVFQAKEEDSHTDY